MVSAASALQPHGIRIEPDGAILLERERITAPEVIGGEKVKVDHVLYQVANASLSAVIENPGRISAYQVFNTGPILEQGAWRQTLIVDGEPLTGYPPRTRVRGRLMTETWQSPNYRLTVDTFCDGELNIVYQAYRFENLDNERHILESVSRASLLTDEDQGAYGIRFDERLGAIVAILGRVYLDAEPHHPGEGAAGMVPARAVLIGADLAPDEWRVSDQRVYLTYRLEVPAREERGFCLIVTGGWGRAEHQALFEQARKRWRERLAEIAGYGDWLATRLEIEDASLHGMFVAGLNAAVSAYRQDHRGRFSGLLPAPESGFEVASTMLADAYWSSQALLPFRPEMVRDEILALARAVHEDGRLARSIRTLPRPEEAPAAPGLGPYDRWPDASDSPSYFAMLVHDYLAWTGERGILDEREGSRTVWDKVLACVHYLRSLDTNHDFLFEKRRNQPDWAFDVLRDDWVTYDLALHCQALKSAAEIALLRGDEQTARDLGKWAEGTQSGINGRLWDEGHGYYVDYIRSYQGFVERHAALDTTVAVLFGVATEHQSHRHLEHLERILETRHNSQQYYGDWGVMNCFPFYREHDDLVGRSAWAYSFHNGAAWPGWSGIYALAELLHRRPGWRYALERWWTYGLAQYWFTPTEYYAPPYDAPSVRRGAALYAWSSVPAAAMILGGFGFWPNLAGEVVLHVPGWGDSRLNGVRLRGASYDVEAESEVITVYQDGREIASSPRGLRLHLGARAVTGEPLPR
jgi:hypothetical protein